MSKEKDACYGCERRVVGCHSSCADYQAYCEALSEKKRKIYKERNQEKLLRDYRIKAVRRVQHKKDVDWKG